MPIYFHAGIWALELDSMSSKPITIALIPNLGFRASFAIFATTFGLLWLVVEPLGFFGLLPNISGSLAWLAYLSLIGISIASVSIAHVLFRHGGQAKLTFITFTVASSSDGASHLVRAPLNMQLRDFVYLSNGPAKERIRQLRTNFEPILQVEKEGGFIDLDQNQTLSQAGVKDGNLCQIRGKPLPERKPMFSRAPRQ